MKKQTLIESVISRYNFYQEQLAENMANIIYLEKVKAELVADRDKAEVDSGIRAQLNKNIAEADKGIMKSNQNIDSGKMLLKAFEKLIADLSKKAKK